MKSKNKNNNAIVNNLKILLTKELLLKNLEIREIMIAALTKNKERTKNKAKK